MDKAESQLALDRARRLQEEYWDALSELEAAVGFDVDGTDELPALIDELEEKDSTVD